VKLKLNLEEKTVMKYILVILSICLLVVSAQAGTFKDDFEDGNLDGWRQGSPFSQTPTLWKIVDGELECTYQNSISTLLLTGEESWKDYTIEYDVKLLKDFGPGDVDVIARSKNPIFSHMMAVSFGDFVGVPSIFAQRLPGDVIANRPFDLEMNQWHHFKLEVNQENFVFWINGQIVLEIQDNFLKEGTVGIGLANYSAHFDNVIITGKDVPDNLSAVVSQDKLTTSWGQIKSR
jgi:hypothetical protein